MTGARAIGHIVAAMTAFVAGRPKSTTFVVLGLAAASSLYAVNNLGIDTDTAGMISAELPWRQDFDAYRQGFPVRDRNIVVVVDGANGADARDFARDLADTLSAEPGLFPTVFLEGHGDFFERNGLLYLSIDELEELAERLIEAQPLLGRLQRDVSGAAIIALIRESLAVQDLAAGTEAELDRLLDELTATIAASQRGERRPLPWRDLLGGDTPPSRQTLLVQPRLADGVLPARDAIERIRAAAAELNIGRSAPVRVRLTGTLAMEHEELTSISNSAAAAGIAALVMVVLVLLWALRSLRLLVIAVVTLFAGLSFTAWFAAVSVGDLNLLSVAFAVLYVGLGVDFILHLSLRFKELRLGGNECADAVVATARGVGGSLVICAVTTAAGFFAFIPTDFVGISELGLISGAGMFISLIVSLTLLPALIVLLEPTSANARGSRRPHRFDFAPTAPIRTAAVAAAVAVGAMLLLPGLRFDGNPVNLRDPQAESIRTLEDLAADSDAPLYTLAVLVPDADRAEAVASSLAGLDVVDSVRTIASLVPRDQQDKLFVLEQLRVVLGTSLSGFSEAAIDPAGLAAELGRLVTADAAAEPSAARMRLVRAADVWLTQRDRRATGVAIAEARALDEDLRGDLVDLVQTLDRGLAASRFGRDQLPAALRERWVNDLGQEMVEIVPAEDVSDEDAAASFVDAVRSIAPNATGLAVVYREAAATVTRAFFRALVYAFVVVSLLLLVLMRSLRDCLLVLAPIAFAAIMTAAISVLLGWPLNFANVIALPLLIGVGVDSGIHMVHRMRTEPPADGNALHTSTSRAVFASALTTVASFGNLAFASHVGMASMGQLLTLGMLMSLVAVLGLLPALMHLGRSK